MQCKNVGCLWLPSNTPTWHINIKFDWCVVTGVRIPVCEFYNGFRVWLIQSRIYLFNRMFHPGIYKMFVLSMIKWLSFVILVIAEDITERIRKREKQEWIERERERNVCEDSIIAPQLLFWLNGWWLWPTDAGSIHRART